MKLRVLHVITTLGRGGAERQLVNLVCNTSEEKYEHLVVSLHPPDDFAHELRTTGHEVVCLNLPTRAPWLFAPLRLKPILNRYQPHLIQTWLYEADFAVRLTIRRQSIPIINTLHQPAYEPETIAAGQWPNWKMQILRQIDRLTARWAKPQFIAVSETVRQSAIRQLQVPPAHVRVIYNSIDVATLNSAPGEAEELRASLGIPSDGFVFLNVARLAPQKGQALLLQAFRSVALENPRVYLAFVGDGPLRGELELLAASLGIDDRARFLGRREDVGTYLELADVFVFPSLVEGLPLAPIEAMLSELPCIASRIGPMEELITSRENGILVSPGSVDELSEAMTEMLTCEELRKSMASRAKKTALERFDHRQGLVMWERVYREIAKVT